MTEKEFKNLLRKYSQNEASEQEKKRLYNYYNFFEDKPGFPQHWTNEDRERMKAEMRKSLSEKLEGHALKEEFSKKVVYMSWKKVAAAMIAIILISGTLFFYINTTSKHEKDQPVLARKMEVKENRVMFLPDGSRVYLKGNSTLHYSPEFLAEKREVILNGEAFFDIQKNIHKPFIVKTRNIETVVLGTAFNILMSNEAGGDITVTVKRGKVKVMEGDQKTLGVLNPNEQMVYHEKSSKAMLSAVTSDQYLDWRKNDLVFENVTLPQAAKILEEQFEVSILVEKEEKETRKFTATFSKDISLERALNILCNFTEASYTWDSATNKVIIRD